MATPEITPAELRALRLFVRDCWWMARRYADGRTSYAPDLFNERMADVLPFLNRIEPDMTAGADADGYSAKDGMFDIRTVSERWKRPP